VVTAFLGFGVGGNIPIDTTICLEFLPQNRRFLLALLSIFQPIGVVLCSVIAYGFIPNYSCSPNFSEADPLKSCHDAALVQGEVCCTKESNMGWRYLLYTLGAITFSIFLLRFVVFRFQESPKFLVYRNRDADAIRVLERIAKTNKHPCTLSLQDLEAVDTQYGKAPDAAMSGKLGISLLTRVKNEGRRVGILFSTWQWTRVTILVWLTYICDFWGFTLAGE
jgi:MFS family permease